MSRMDEKCQKIMQKIVQTTLQILVSMCSKVNAKLDSDIKTFDGLFLNHMFCFLKKVSVHCIGKYQRQI